MFVHRGLVLADTTKFSWIAPKENEFILVYNMLSDLNAVVLPDIAPTAMRDDHDHDKSHFRRFAPELAVNIMRRRFPELPLSHILEALRDWDGDPLLAQIHLRRDLHERMGRRWADDHRPDRPGPTDRAPDLPDGVDQFFDDPAWADGETFDDQI
jgi:hypothetical protein